ncbi:hypothetical protein BC826DRAFT_261667 [Russula brevipes]|nr:hypothetical protein BC826DRAFT_261667 [Russula brevipes]
MLRSVDASQRKRVEVGKISRPKLVSASTSVDTIFPFGTRFKRICGSLRAKPVFPASDESTQPQHSLDLDLSSANADRSLAGTPDGPLPFSASEPSRSKIAIASP